uniref:Nucleoid-associated protein K4G66_26145 n=1 Tax=Roseihalotalea indica TaxID=2867963 RepID=A0AA49GM15_9BACT|nr:YbaB/EbfC family nucleoid-associated protein [Tunicatimonas sp. TK19036]
MFDMNKMMEKVREVQEKMKQAQEGLTDITATGEAGAGLVKATVNGKKQLVNLEIDNDLIKPEDKEVMQDLVIAAVNKALEEVDAKAKEEMKKSTEGFIPNIPGFDLGNFT